eukprot:g1584.t1
MVKRGLPKWCPGCDWVILALTATFGFTFVGSTYIQPTDVEPATAWARIAEVQQKLKGYADLPKYHHQPAVDNAALLWWFLRDRRLDVNEATEKLVKCLRWRQKFRVEYLGPDMFMKELRAGKGYVHEHRDLAGRPVMVAIARRHSIFERDLLESSRMCTWMLETALKRLSMAEPPKKPAQEPEGPPEQALGIFDLRGFSPLQADLEVAGFLIEALYNYYPGRTGKVLLVGAPELFKAFWDNIKPLLGKYSKLADFVTVDELRENYFKPGLEPPEFRKDSSGVPALAVKTCVGSAALASLAFAGATAWLELALQLLTLPEPYASQMPQPLSVALLRMSAAIIEETRDAVQQHGERLQVLGAEDQHLFEPGSCDAVVLAAFAARPVVDISRLAHAVTFALLVAQHLSRDIGSAQGPQVRIASSKLVVVPNSPAGAEPIFELPLLLCHICLAEDRLAVAPSTTGKYSQLCDVWILKVHGDAARALKILAKYGAVRYDLSAVYVLGSKLSSGSMSSVYRAQLHASEDPSESNVNMKVIPTGGQQAEKRVAQELELQLAAQSHSSVTRLLSVFQVSDHPLGPCCAVAMALTSQNLFDWVFSSSASEPFAAGIMKGLLSGLHHMHQQEIFYRNISPETIQLAPDRRGGEPPQPAGPSGPPGRHKHGFAHSQILPDPPEHGAAIHDSKEARPGLPCPSGSRAKDLKPTYSDFSLATRLAELKRRPIQLGYPGYTAPEILLNMEPTLQSDVFAVGAVLFFMMAKQQPFSELEVGTAVNSCIKQSIQLDQYEDFQASHDLKPGLGRCFVEGGGVRWISPMLP